MVSLFQTKFNWSFFAIIAILLLLLFPGLSWYSYFALLISFHQFILLFYSMDYVIPIRYLFGAMMCLQMFIGPAMAYNGLDQYQYFMYKMQVPEAEYFSYAIPAVVCFILGLHVTAGRLKGEMIDEKGIKVFTIHHPQLTYYLIGIGFGSSIIATYFSSQLAFLFYLISGFKFVGAFLLILGEKRLKVVPLILVYTSIILSSLGGGMFHDLLTWLIMLGAVLAIKYKPGTNLKIIFTFSFIILVVIIQQLKGFYRAATGQGAEAGVETFQRVYEEREEAGGLFSFKSLAQSNVRINQGFIVTNILKTVPSKVPYADGAELRQILEAAFLPRVLAPNKLNAGDRTIFTKYSGMNIRSGTSMGLSSVGDAYVNFGVVGGCIFMFFLGLLYNWVLKVFYKYGKEFPLLLIFTPLVFYYPIRPDCELQTIMGHLVKSCFVIWVVFFFWKNYFRGYKVKETEEEETKNALPRYSLN